jgi:predicted nucleic acid-binding protein
LTLYADTSALVKLYVRESGSAAMRRACEASLVATSVLAWAELHTAFARRLREGATPLAHGRAAAALARDWGRWARVELSEEVLARIPGLVGRYPLRGADAVHFASAQLLAETGGPFRFAASDHRLLTAAIAEGWDAFDPAHA